MLAILVRLSTPLGDQPFDVVVGNLAVGFGSSDHRLGAVEAQADSADGNHGVSYGWAGNFPRTLARRLFWETSSRLVI